MAQTWPFSRRRRALLRVADFAGRLIARPFGRSAGNPLPRFVERILVIEPWNIGDVVLATPILRELRRRYPKARISILARPHGRELLAGSGLVDDVIVFDLPWTAQTNKYRFTPARMREMRRLVRTLRANNFDLTLDSRMDIRSNVLAAMSRAPYRLGYDIGGGGWLLTHSLPSDRDTTHRIDDWLSLLDLLPDAGAPITDERRPTVDVTAVEREGAQRKLRERGAKGSPVIAYHPGGSHPGKRWPRASFEELIRELSASLGGTQVVFLGPDETSSEGWPDESIVFREPLRELMALISCCDVLVCNDSGPMHIADALRVPVVAIFEIGNPQWFGPSGPRARVIRGELAGTGISAAPLDHPPRNPIDVRRVAAAVKEILAEGA
jgi:ADP-heptose:LPS heptosyltransferase